MDHHAAAAGGELDGDRAADPAGGAGDQGVAASDHQRPILFHTALLGQSRIAQTMMQLK
jgi:hypothetical protein